MDAQFELLPQVPLQEFGVPEGVGVDVGVDVGVSDGVGVGVPDGVDVGVGVVIVRLKESEQFPGFDVGVGDGSSWAKGTLDGATGEIDVCLS